MKKISLLLAMGMLLSGCTAILWERPHRVEAVYGMYLASEEGNLYVLSSRHGYVFPVDDSFQRILVLSRSLPFSTSLCGFEQTRDFAISGKVELSIAADRLSDRQTAELTGLGFKSSQKAEDQLVYTTRISGKGYCRIENVPIAKFKKKMYVRVALPRTAAGTARSIALTPVAMATDAVVTVPSGVVMVLLLSVDSYMDAPSSR